MSSNSTFNQSSQAKASTGYPASLHNVQPRSHLEVLNHPAPLQRRSSHTSAFSDISDLDYMSNDPNTGLLKTVSNISTFSNYSNAEPLTWRERARTLYYQNYGAMLVLVSQVFGSGMNVAARLLEQPGAHGAPMHPFQILFTRQTLTALLCTGYALTTKSIPYFPLGPPDPKVRLLLVSRGLFGFFGVFGMYFSLLYLPLSEATVMTFLAPILTCYICSLLLPGESFTRQQQIAGIVSFVGVVFIAQPFSFLSTAMPASHGVDGIITPDTTGAAASDPYADHDPTHPTPRQHLLAIGIAMLGVCGATGAMTSIRAIGTRAHAFISINYFSVWSAIVSLIALIVIPGVSFRLPSNLIEWGLLLSLGVCGFIMQGLLTMGLAYGGPANVPNSSAGPIPTSAISVDDAGRNLLGSKAMDDDIEMQTHLVSDSPSSSSHHLQPIIRRKTLSRTSSSNNTKSQPNPRKSKPQPHPSGNRATSMVYCQMLFALAADKIIFGTTMGVWSWIGSGLILGGAVWVATAKEGNSTTKTKAKKPTPPNRQHGLYVDEGRPQTISTHSSHAKPTKPGKAKAEQAGLLHNGAFHSGDDYDFDEDVDTTDDESDEQDLGGVGMGTEVGSGRRRRRRTAHSIFSTSTLSSPTSSRRSASIALSPKSMVPVR